MQVQHELTCDATESVRIGEVDNRVFSFADVSFRILRLRLGVLLVVFTIRHVRIAVSQDVVDSVNKVVRKFRSAANFTENLRHALLLEINEHIIVGIIVGIAL